MGVVSPFVRKVKTASGATAVQIAVKEGRRDKVIEHLGSAHTEAELAALMEIGRHRIAPGQLALDPTPMPPGVIGPLSRWSLPACRADLQWGHPQSPVRDRLASPASPQHPASLPGPGPGAGLPREPVWGPV